jgi:hypothetical protein
MVVGNTVKFQEFDLVKVKNLPADSHALSGYVIKCNESAFGETYWIQWNDGKQTLMHGDNLEKASIDKTSVKP